MQHIRKLGSYQTRLDWARARVILVGRHGTKIIEMSEISKEMNKERKC